MGHQQTQMAIKASLRFAWGNISTHYGELGGSQTSRMKCTLVSGEPLRFVFNMMHVSLRSVYVTCYLASVINFDSSQMV